MWPAQDNAIAIPGDRVYFLNYNYGLFTNTDDDGAVDPRVIDLWRKGWAMEVTPAGRRLKDRSEEPTAPALLGREPKDITQPRPIADYLLQGENAFYMGLNKSGKPFYEGLGLSGTEQEMRKELQDAYNGDFNHMIAFFKALANPNGELNADGSEIAITWKGVDVTAMTDDDMLEQITLHVQRVGHEEE